MGSARLRPPSARPHGVAVAVAGHPTPTAQEFRAILAGLAVGQIVAVTVLRDGGLKQLSATLGHL